MRTFESLPPLKIIERAGWLRWSLTCCTVTWNYK